MGLGVSFCVWILEMEEEISNQLDKVRLSEEERSLVYKLDDEEFEDTERKFTNSLVFKLITARNVNSEIFMKMMPKIWNNILVKFKCVGNNIFLGKFICPKDKDRVISESLWIYDKALLAFEEPNSNASFSEQEFRYASF